MNKKKLLTIAIYTSFLWIIFKLLYTGDVINYLHPRMIKFLVFALIVLTIITLYQIITFLTESFDNGHKQSKLAYSKLICFVPVLLFSLNPQSISGKVLENKVLDISIDSTSRNLAKEVETKEDIDVITENENVEIVVESINESTEIYEMESDSSNSVMEVPTIEDILDINQDSEIAKEIKDDDFMDTIIGLYSDEESYLNQPITLDGFIYREDYFEEGTAVISRLYINCCAADATIVGVLCTSDDIVEIESEGWVTVEGTLTYGQIFSPYTETYEEVLMIENPLITPIEPYDSPYVYYNF